MRDNHGKKASTYRVLAFVLAAILFWALIPGPDLEAAPSLAEIQKDLKEVRAKKGQLADKKTKLTGDLAYLEKRSEAQRAVYEDDIQQKEVALMLL